MRFLKGSLQLVELVGGECGSVSPVFLLGLVLVQQVIVMLFGFRYVWPEIFSIAIRTKVI